MGFNLRLYNEGKYLTKDQMAAVARFDAAGILESCWYLGKDGTKRFVHSIRFPKKALTSQSRIETTSVTLDKADPSVVVEEVQEYDTPNASASGTVVEVYYDNGLDPRTVQLCTGDEFLAWYEPVDNAVPEVFQPDRTEAKSMIAAARRTEAASQEKLNQEVNKKEAEKKNAK